METPGERSNTKKSPGRATQAQIPLSNANIEQQNSRMSHQNPNSNQNGFGKGVLQTFNVQRLTSFNVQHEVVGLEAQPILGSRFQAPRSRSFSVDNGLEGETLHKRPQRKDDSYALPHGRASVRHLRFSTSKTQDSRLTTRN